MARWLEDGYRLTLDSIGDRPDKITPKKVIWSLLEDATATIEKQPDNERRWLTSGLRSSGWSSAGSSVNDVWELEKTRILSAMKPFDGSTGTTPQGSSIDRAVDVLEWLRYCLPARNPHRLQKAAYALARGGETEAVMRIYAPNRKSHSRQIALEIRTRSTGYIMVGLRKDFGLVAMPDGRFVQELALAA